MATRTKAPTKPPEPETTTEPEQIETTRLKFNYSARGRYYWTIQSTGTDRKEVMESISIIKDAHTKLTETFVNAED